MPATQITLAEYCGSYGINASFVQSLEENDLITLTTVHDEVFIEFDNLPELEQYTRWYQEFDVNAGGIDTIRHLLQRIKSMQEEIEGLKQRLRIYEQP